MRPSALDHMTVLEIDKLLREDLSHIEIANRLGVSKAIVGSISRGDTWSWVTKRSREGRRKAICPICGERWRVKRGKRRMDPVPIIAEKIEKEGCSRCQTAPPPLPSQISESK